ncbi:MAG TPA: CRTAC1 family protein [Bryobacteraceae bacterium]|nr:CRTAC1 family protein [Bryobacteraceae bacterium]
MRSALALACAAAAITAATSPPLFEDRSERSGILFSLNNAATPERRQIETMAGGVAAFDYDNDGYPDIFFANGAAQPSLNKTGPAYYNRLYRNRGGWTFEDVTDKAGLRGEGYAMGAAAGDFDNDGHTDLYVVGVKRSILYRNRGDGVFEDVTERAGVGNVGRWAVDAAWLDYDNDGRLDLFVVNYVKWDPAQEPFCGDARAGFRTYCHPRYYQGLPNALYHNNGDGTFTDVSQRAGIAQHIGKGMGLAIADFDGDGRIDIFVANDAVPNFLFHNEGGGVFREVGFQAGVAMNDDGRALSSMGVDFRDIDNDGRPDLFITALANETFPLYRNLGKGLFADVTYPSKVGAATMPRSGWGCGIFDFDNDGRKDLFSANGDVQNNTELYSGRTSRQPNLLLLNQPDGSFAPVEIGAPALHRGAAFADFDRDGRIDIVISRIGERPVVLRNVMGAGNHWIALQLAGSRSNRDAIGARVHLVSASGEQWNQATRAVGYASSSVPTVHFGLGNDAEAQRIEIDWPSGVKQRLEHVRADRYLAVREP